MKKHYSIDDLLSIMEKLRSPDGCPWDRAQTHQSIKKCMLEETYEAMDALDKNDDAAFANELGDMLMQIVFHSQLAKERGAFEFNDVVDEICQKLIDRHTHVFGENKAKDEKDALNTWEQNKKKEKGLYTQSQLMRDVPRILPALLRATKVQKKAADVGFDWDSIYGAHEKVLEEAQEVLDAVKEKDKAKIFEEIGDLLFAVVNVARFSDIDSEEALYKATDKFINRFEVLEQIAQQNCKNLLNMTIEELEMLWQQAKKQES